jgi:RNA polymerase sigma factor (sigma-70 family)
MNISETCEHFDLLELETSNKRRFFHSDPTEAQIQFAQTLSTAVLPGWARGELDYGGALREEPLIFLIQQFKQIGDAELASDLSAILNDRICVRTVNTYRRSLGESAAWDLAAELCLEFWAEVLDPESVQAVWVEICFWRVVKNLAKDYRKKQLRVSQRFPSLDSDRATAKIVMQLPSNGIGLEDQIYLQEFLDSLTPTQRTAVVLWYSGNSSINEIGATLGCSETAVRTVLHGATTQLAKAA